MSKQKYLDSFQTNEKEDALYLYKEIKINIFKGQSGDDGRNNYFWVKKMTPSPFFKPKFETPIFYSVQEVKDDIVKYYESLLKDENWRHSST